MGDVSQDIVVLKVGTLGIGYHNADCGFEVCGHEN